MSISVKYAREIVTSLENHPIPNFIAQAKAKQVLQDVNETPENFPNFTEGIDDRATFIAYRMLTAGCSLVEHKLLDEGHVQLKSAGDLLESVHSVTGRQDLTSNYHCLIGAMAFYASGHYSRGFVLVKNIETVTPIAGVVASFLRKDTKKLILRMNEVLLNPNDLNGLKTNEEHALSVIITRSVALTLEFSVTGNITLLETAKAGLRDAMLISESGSNPSYWWISRLFSLILDDFEQRSLWKVLPKFFDPEASEGLNDYISLLSLSSPPVTELWESQLKSVPLALDLSNVGGVINLRTSAGKTRVAELAILKTLSANPSAKILYLAPFRSLAFELEQTFSKLLGEIGYSVSHLYGGSRFSSIDKEIVDDAQLLIATPEKAKAMLRASPEILNDMGLVVIDEGHLLGESERDVKNELFLEHLRLLCRNSNARMLMLSAVLPNAEELATWIGGNNIALAKSHWKPSDERFGILEWRKSGVQIEWKGSEPCFNPDFIKFIKVTELGKRPRKFPRTKTEAVAATAVRLTKLGSVLIFAGQAQWVPSMARAVILALGEDAVDYEWPEIEWRVFEAVCDEELGTDSPELNAARLGVICHSNKLPPQVRIAVEKLMSVKSPRVIVATTTLGQGVNIGITSVIVSQTLIGKNRWISNRDFWNICGRAGRAFVDGEGKILYALDLTKKDRQVRNDKARAEKYLDISNLNTVKSGLLLIMKHIKQLASDSGVSFEVLLELLANNRLSELVNSEEALDCIDLIDDQLLALHLAYEGSDDDSLSIDWIETAFEASLASIQESNDLEDENELIMPFLKARGLGVLKEVPDVSARRAIVGSGLPLSVAKRAFQDLDLFRESVNTFIDTEDTELALLQLVEFFESWATEYASQICEVIPDIGLLEQIRPLWLKGLSLKKIKDSCGDEAIKVCSKFYGYELSWLCHAIAQQFDGDIDEEKIEVLALVGLLLELGLPNEAASKVFLAGVRSRLASVELAQYVANPSASIKGIREALLDVEIIEGLASTVSKSTIDWLYMLKEESQLDDSELPEFPPFILETSSEDTLLHARTLEGDDTIYLCSANLEVIVKGSPSTEFPFLKYANDPSFVFKKEGDTWFLENRDPRVKNM